MYPRLMARFPFLLLCLFILSVPAFAGDEWRPIDPSEMAMKASVVERDADAEAIFWEVRVDDSDPYELSLKNYIRIKVFTERGRESQSKVDLPFFGSSRIKDIAARVVKPDGTIIELKKEDIFERTIVKLSGLKLKAKTFALAGIEPGSIIEYRWREVRPGSANHLRLQFQRDIPVETVNYFLKPCGNCVGGMRYQPFHIGDTRFVKDKDGFFRIGMTNMPAFREEPRMPPEDEVRSWVLLYYSDDDKIEPEQYWKAVGKAYYEATKDGMKVNDDVKTAVAGIIGNATTPEEKLQRIYDFCRTKIKNVSDDASGLTDDEKAKLKENKSPADTLKRGMGTGLNIDMLFAALAKAAGFDARLALSGNRDDLFFDRSLANDYFLESSFIAVRVGDVWKFFSPAEMYTPFGMLGWPEEGQETLLADSKEPVWVKTPVATVQQSVEKRTGKFRLLDDGTLEGDVRIEYTGHLGAQKKEYNDDDSPTQREATLRESVKAQMSTAEISELKIENVQDPIAPFVYQYHVRVPGYAQRTGKRLFLQPSFFEHGVSPLFATSERKYSVYFHFPWSEEDDIQIQLPEGFALDNADSPGSFSAGPISQYKVVMGTMQNGKLLVYKRSFFFGGEERILFPVTGYTQLKAYFDTVSKSDNHTITLKQATATASSN